MSDITRLISSIFKGSAKAFRPGQVVSYHVTPSAIVLSAIAAIVFKEVSGG
nr:hypothetical protein [Bacillota bacterium]